jgi:hypothetical protein
LGEVFEGLLDLVVATEMAESCGEGKGGGIVRGKESPRVSGDLDFVSDREKDINCGDDSCAYR